MCMTIKNMIFVTFLWEFVSNTSDIYWFSQNIFYSISSFINDPVK